MAERRPIEPNWLTRQAVDIRSSDEVEVAAHGKRLLERLEIELRKHEDREHRNSSADRPLHR